MNQKTFKTDYEFGKSKELSILNTIKEYFNDPDIKQSSNTYERYDFIGNNIYELKSRNCNYSTYPTTLLPKSKIIKTDKPQIFLFNFTDGLYYIKYEPSIFDTIDCKMFKRNTRSDYNDIPQPYYHIPIRILQKI